jgi:hypothetical protein
MSDKPKQKTIITDRTLNASEGIPRSLTIVVKNNVKNVKLRTNPETIPNGRLDPAPTPLDRTIGRTGKIHGERIVTIPARNAKSISKIICASTHYKLCEEINRVRRITLSIFR